MRQVRRHNGEVVPFRERSIARKLQWALSRVGEGDVDLAAELASAVTLFLSRFRDGSIPSEEDVQSMLVRVLEDAGHHQAAQLMETSAAARRRMESELLVRCESSANEDSETTGDEARWQLDRLLRHLTVVRGLPETLAEDVAEGVERRLSRLEFKQIAPRLIQELVNSELEDQGIETGLRSEEFPGLLREDLDEFLTPGFESRGLPGDIIAGRTLSAYALSAIHRPEVGRAHRRADLHLYGLRDPFKIERLRLDGDLFLESGMSVHEIMLALARKLPVLWDQVGGEIFLSDLLRWCAEGLGTQSPDNVANGVLDVLSPKDAYGRPRSVRCRLNVPLTGVSPTVGLSGLVAAIVRAALERAEDPTLCSFTLTYVAGGEVLDPSLDDRTIERMAALLDAQLVIRREPEPPLIRPCPRHVNMGLLRVAINLPVALVDVPTDAKLASALEHLRGVAESAAAALHERYWHQRCGHVQGLQALAATLGGPGQVEMAAEDQHVEVEVWGLSHALDLLTDRRVTTEGKRGDCAARILAFLDYVLGEPRDGVSLKARLGATRDRAVRKRMLLSWEEQMRRHGIEAREARQDQAELESSLPVVLPLWSKRNKALLDGRFAERLASGLSLSLAAFEGAALLPTLERLAKESRLSVLSLRPRKPGEDVFEVQGELF